MLASVDGPLPNGPNANPEDSDITRYGWDARADHLQRIVRPGPRTLHVHREPESGRIVGAPLDGPLSRPLGGPVARIRTEGALPAWLGGGREIVRDIRWQDLGALRYATAITHGDGSVDRFEPVPPPAQPETSRSGLAGGDTASWLAPPGQEHDSAGLPSRVSTNHGIQRLHWNAAGQLERTEREDSGHSDYLYDARGRRVIQLVCANPARTRTWSIKPCSTARRI